MKKKMKMKIKKTKRRKDEKTLQLFCKDMKKYLYLCNWKHSCCIFINQVITMQLQQN